MAERAPWLQPDEDVLLERGRHPRSMLDVVLAVLIIWGIVGGILALVVPLLRPELRIPIAVPIAGFAFVAGIILLIARALRVQTSRYVVTNERVYKSYGRLRFFLSQTTYDKLTDIHVKQGIFGRRYGFGTIRLETAGDGVALEGIRDPMDLKQAVEEARTRFIEHLVGEEDLSLRDASTEGRTGPDGAPERRARPERGATLWSVRPVVASLIGPLIFGGLFLTVGLALLVAAIFVPPLALGGLFMLLIGGLQALGAFVQLKYTTYYLQSHGVVVTSGWLTRRRVETTFDKVTDVTTYQGVLGRMFNHGQITINTAGSASAPVIFRGIRDPDAAKASIDEARRRWGRS